MSSESMQGHEKEDPGTIVPRRKKCDESDERCVTGRAKRQATNNFADTPGEQWHNFAETFPFQVDIKKNS